MYHNLCIKFGVDKNTKWTVRDGINPDSHMGLGTCYTDKGIISLGGFKAGAVAADNMKFMQPGDRRIDSFYIKIPDGSWRVEIKRIHQDLSNKAWNQFILRTSNGFTNTGLDRIDESIRVYVWCILGAQSNSKSRISKDDVASAAKVNSQYYWNNV